MTIYFLILKLGIVSLQSLVIYFNNNMISLFNKASWEQAISIVLNGRITNVYIINVNKRIPSQYIW